MTEDGTSENKHELTYHFDKYLMYLIQDVTKRSSAEIVNFFYELSGVLADASLKGIGADQTAVKRSAVDYFPDSAIPFRILVKGSIWDRYSEDCKWEFDIEVGFPNETSPMPEEDLKKISLQLMENALFDAEHKIVAPVFTKPDIRASASFRTLMSTFMGRSTAKKTRKKKDGRNTTQTT